MQVRLEGVIRVADQYPLCAVLNLFAVLPNDPSYVRFVRKTIDAVEPFYRTLVHKDEVKICQR